MPWTDNDWTIDAPGDYLSSVGPVIDIGVGINIADTESKIRPAYHLSFSENYRKQLLSVY
ncbi:hypothetical protein D3C80_2102420 [compost metagenome]